MQQNIFEGSEINKIGRANSLKNFVKSSFYPSVLCRIDREISIVPRIIAYNKSFEDLSNLKASDIIGKDYNILIHDNSYEHIQLIKKIKELEPTAVKLTIYPKSNDLESNEKLDSVVIFTPLPYDQQDTIRYCIFNYRPIPENESNTIISNQYRIDENYKKTLNNIQKYVDENSTSIVKESELEKSIIRERVLRSINEMIGVDEDINNTMNGVAKIICEYLRVDRCIIHDFDKHEECTFLVDYCSNEKIQKLDTEKDAQTIKNYVRFNTGLFKRDRIETKKHNTLIENDTEANILFKKIKSICNKLSIKSQIIKECIFNKEVNSRIYIHQCNAPRYWRADEIDFIETVSHQLALVVERWKTLNRLKDLNKELIKRTWEIKNSFQQEKKLRQMQTEFVAIVSHEFKTPLQIIDSSREVLTRKIKKIGLLSECKKFLIKISDAVGRMNSLVEGVLDLSKMESGEFSEMNANEFDLKNLIRSIIARNIHSSKNINFNLDIDSVPENFYGDKKLLDHVFLNLIENAIKYSNPNSTVAIESKQDKENIIIAVKDQGIGIPQKDIGKIFHKFSRASNTTAIAGSGIGLYLVKKFIEMHDGRVGVNSEENIGTSFYVLLPIKNNGNHVKIEDIIESFEESNRSQS